MVNDGKQPLAWPAGNISPCSVAQDLKEPHPVGAGGALCSSLVKPCSHLLFGCYSNQTNLKIDREKEIFNPRAGIAGNARIKT